MESKTKKSNINKTWVLITVLIVLTAILLIISIQAKDPTIEAPTPTPEEKREISYATLKISDKPRISTISGKYEVDVELDTDENEVTIVQLEMEYDPQTLRIYEIDPGNLIQNPEILEKKIDIKNGTIKYWLAVNEDEGFVQGNDSVATIRFTKIGTEAAEINFRPKTSINARNSSESVLKDMLSGIIEKLPTPTPRPTRIINPTTPPIQDN